MVYLRGVLVSAFEAGTMPRDGPMFLVLSRLLKFTPQEQARIATRGGGGGGGGGVTGGAQGGGGMHAPASQPANQSQGGWLSFGRTSFTRQ